MKKKPIKKKKANSKKPQKSPSISKERFYPDITEKQELAIIKMCEGIKLPIIANELGVKLALIYDWRSKDEAFQKALKTEWERIICESRDIHSEMIRKATENVFTEIKKGNANFSYQFLSDSGFLPSSMDKTERDRLAQELAEKLINVANQS